MIGKDQQKTGIHFMSGFKYDRFKYDWFKYDWFKYDWFK